MRESVEIIRAEGARTAESPSAVSAVQDVQTQFGIPVVSIASLTDLLVFLERAATPELAQFKEPIARYREQYGTQQDLNDLGTK
ncbi:MAG: hypothetical protein EBT04_04230 [Betaproteobacteria bacterium]|nr:hypothetical protein [Betaproteobacteria bacterium]